MLRIGVVTMSRPHPGPAIVETVALSPEVPQPPTRIAPQAGVITAASCIRRMHHALRRGPGAPSICAGHQQYIVARSLSLAAAIPGGPQAPTGGALNPRDALPEAPVVGVVGPWVVDDQSRLQPCVLCFLHDDSLWSRLNNRRTLGLET